ncbi:IS1 family transposase, partial [Escherichia coli]|uniref:IS1 family transposase n=1 Tax=Escherichia coli TaxID=562 RepID=UPI003D9A2FDD
IVVDNRQCAARCIGRGYSRCDRYRNTHEMCQCFGSIEGFSATDTENCATLRSLRDATQTVDLILRTFTIFGERTMATLGRLMSLLSPFDVVIWMTDGWPLYESRLKGKLHVISKRYTQRIERHNLNLRQHLARLGRKSLSFSKSVELHDKVIGHYLNIKHYQ